MDTRADAEEYDAMDFADVNQRFADDALALLGPGGGEVLDIGTGTADIPVRMAKAQANVRVLGVDLADEMLRVAAHKIVAAGVDDRVRLARLDAKGLRLSDGKFDLVVSNSVAHHIPNPLELFREIVRAVRPGGAILVRDLFRPSSMDEAWATVNRVAAGDSPKQKQLFFDSLCAALTLDEVRALCVSAGLLDVRVALSSDRHWTVERPRTLTS